MAECTECDGVGDVCSTCGCGMCDCEGCDDRNDCSECDGTGEVEDDYAEES